MRNYALMTTEELIDLCKNGTPEEQTEAAEYVVINNDHLVLHIINKFFSSYRYRYLDDMCQEGRLALSMHMRDFDPKKGKFSTFITPYIVDGIKTYICSVHGITTHYAAQIKRYHKALDALAQRDIENPTFGDIAEEMGVGLDAVQRAHEMANRINSVSIEGDNKDKTMSSPYSNSPDAIVEAEEERRSVERAVAELPEDEREVISELYFSDSGGKEVPLSDVAARLGLDVSTVRRLKNLGLRRLERSKQLTDYSPSAKRRSLEKFSEGLLIQFSLPEDIVEANLNIAISLPEDIEYEPISLS